MSFNLYSGGETPGVGDIIQRVAASMTYGCDANLKMNCPHLIAQGDEAEVIAIDGNGSLTIARFALGKRSTDPHGQFSQLLADRWQLLTPGFTVTVTNGTGSIAYATAKPLQAQAPAPSPCICGIMTIMATGCICGSIKRYEPPKTW